MLVGAGEWGDLLAVYCITVLQMEKDGTRTGIPRLVPFHSRKTMHTDYTRKGNMGYTTEHSGFQRLRTKKRM